jgi:P27 family predicted phage terminase small subunit
MPRGLPKDAQKAWKILVPALERQGALEPEDAVLVELAARAYGHAMQAAEVIEREGLTSTGSLGQMREHPALTTYRASMASVARALDSLGVGPVLRARLGVAEHQRGAGGMKAFIEGRIGESPRRSFIPTPDEFGEFA